MESGCKPSRCEGPAMPVRLHVYVLRLLAFATTLLAVVLVVMAEETEMLSIQLVPTLPPLQVAATAKAEYSSAFVYFFVANVVACACSVFSLAVSIKRRANIKDMIVPISTIDLIIMALLFSAIGAAMAIGVVGAKGNSHLKWNKICNFYGKLCADILASIIISLVGSMTCMLLVILQIISMHKRSP